MKKTVFLCAVILALLSVLPGAQAASRVFLVLGQAELTDQGNAVIHWKASEHNGPYTVLYEYVDAGGEAKQTRWREAEGVTETFREVKGLIPGKTYRFIIRDRDNAAARAYVTLPTRPAITTSRKCTFTLTPCYKAEASLPDDQAKTFKNLSADAMTRGMAKGYQYGMDFRLVFQNKGSKEIVRSALFVFYAPNGYAYTQYADDFTLPKEAGSGACHYAFLGGGFFDRLAEDGQTVPAGKYRFEIYLDGRFFYGKDFTVKP